MSEEETEESREAEIENEGSFPLQSGVMCPHCGSKNGYMQKAEIRQWVLHGPGNSISFDEGRVLKIKSYGKKECYDCKKGI